MALFARLLVKNAAKTLPQLLPRAFPGQVQACGYKRSLPPMLMEMKRRRKKAGPEPLRHRSVWVEWNYDTELFSFAKRLNEEWSDATLRTAFVQESFVEREEKHRKELGMAQEETTLSLVPNTELSRLGAEFCESYVEDYLALAYPSVPSEGLNAIKGYLLSNEVLSHVSKNIGTADLILCADFPPEQTTLSNVLVALIGGLVRDCGEHRAQLFVQDFVLTQLVGKDANELWDVDRPQERLAAVLVERGRGPAEPRLLWESGRTTLEASFCVGLYSDKQLLGYSVGESLDVAQEMAARDALRKLFGLEQSRRVLPLGKAGRRLSISRKERLTAASEASS